MTKELDQSSLKRWIEDSLKNNTNTLAEGYQGKTLLYSDSEKNLVIKIPHGRGPIKHLHTLMLRHEARIYQQLQHLPGTPASYGLIDNQYLALEFIDGQPIRNKRPANTEHFYASLFDLIGEMHKRGVVHMDLKKKDNLLVTDNDEPCIIDFGVASIRKNGFHPFNHFLYRLGVVFDFNAWIKHKYYLNMDNISDEDKVYFRRTYIEKISKKIKELFTF